MKIRKRHFLVLAVLCSFCLIFSGCAKADISNTNTSPSASGTISGSPKELPSETPSDELSVGEESAAETEEIRTSDTETDKILVVYFSRSGNTKGMAESIAALTGGTLFEIEPSVPYSENYQETVDRHKKELADNARPEIAHTVENWAEYKTVFVGFPLWSGNAPMIIHSFMESYDFSGKTVIPFGTSGGSSGEIAYRNLANAYPDVVFKDGLNLTGSQISAPEKPVATWLESLGLLKEGE